MDRPWNARGSATCGSRGTLGLLGAELHARQSTRYAVAAQRSERRDLGSSHLETRDDEDTQSPLERLHRTAGSCRDFALLFVEAVRSLGLGARIVSGYLHDAGTGLVGSQATGTTHAWAEVYLPRAGWVPLTDKPQCRGRQPDAGSRCAGHEPSHSRGRQRHREKRSV